MWPGSLPVHSEIRRQKMEHLFVAQPLPVLQTDGISMMPLPATSRTTPSTRRSTSRLRCTRRLRRAANWHLCSVACQRRSNRTCPTPTRRCRTSTASETNRSPRPVLDSNRRNLQSSEAPAGDPVLLPRPRSEACVTTSRPTSSERHLCPLPAARLPLPPATPRPPVAPGAAAPTCANSLRGPPSPPRRA